MEHVAFQLPLTTNNDVADAQYQPVTDFTGIFTATEGCQGIQGAAFIENMRSSLKSMVGIEATGKLPSIKPSTLQFLHAAPLSAYLLSRKPKHILTHMVRNASGCSLCFWMQPANKSRLFLTTHSLWEGGMCAEVGLHCKHGGCTTHSSAAGCVVMERAAYPTRSRPVGTHLSSCMRSELLARLLQLDRHIHAAILCVPPGNPWIRMQDEVPFMMDESKLKELLVDEWEKQVANDTTKYKQNKPHFAAVTELFIAAIQSFFKNGEHQGNECSANITRLLKDVIAATVFIGMTNVRGVPVSSC